MMQEKERAVITGLFLTLFVLAAGFYVHRDPSFPGSLAGGVLGISAATLMLVPLAYLFIKRIPFLKKAVTRSVSMRSLLAVHIYAGMLGPILALLHTGHKFQSGLGISLTAMMILVALSGFIGRYLMTRLSTDLRAKQQLLAGLRVAYDRTSGELVKDPDRATALHPFAGFFSRLAASFFLTEKIPSLSVTTRSFRLSESMADVEYAIKTHELAKDVFARWLACHILISIILYTLLAIHIWSGWYFGIRWML